MSKQPTLPAESKKAAPFSTSTDGEVTLNFSIHFDDLIFGDLLGQGGYGKVFKGEWQFNTVAIKQYTAQDFSDKTKAEIRKEAQVMATASTQSDYLVRLKGVILEKPNYSLVMEYLPGGDLFHLLKSSQEITWTMRYRIGLDMTIGLHHLHTLSILHRDLKSLNVLLDLNGRAKLADFGLSTLKTSSASTTGGGFKGTVLWSAPELFKRGAKATTAADIYSLAMVLWELVSRQIPFSDAPSAAIAATWVSQGEQETIPEGTPEEFKTLILDCWHKDPAQRPKASDVAKRLDTLWRTEQKKTPVATPVSPATASGLISGSTPVLAMGAQSGKPLVISGSEGLTGSPAAAMASEQALQVRFGSPSTPVQLSKTPTEDELLTLRDEVAALKLRQAQEELRRQESQKHEEEIARLRAELERERGLKRQDELKKTPTQPEPKKPAGPSTTAPLSQNIYTTLPAPRPVAKPVDEKALSQLLKYVAEGEQDKAEEMIKKDKNLLLAAGTVTDLSGREFKQITAFQYALWALDWHMWKMIQKHLPPEAQIEQFDALESKGTAHGKHFSLQPLTDELKAYVDNAEKVWKYDQRAQTHWQTRVGKAQRLLPAHVINEYCRPDRSFYPCPQFTEETLPRMRAFYDKSDWFTSEYNGGCLGSKFAVARGGHVLPVCAGAGRSDTAGQADLEAVQSLSKTRTQQLDLLASQLKSASSSMGMKR